MNNVLPFGKFQTKEQRAVDDAALVKLAEERNYWKARAKQAKEEYFKRIQHGSPPSSSTVEHVDGHTPGDTGARTQHEHHLGPAALPELSGVGVSGRQTQLATSSTPHSPLSPGRPQHHDEQHKHEQHDSETKSQVPRSGTSSPGNPARHT